MPGRRSDITMIAVLVQLLCFGGIGVAQTPPPSSINIAPESWIVFASAGCKGCKWLKTTCLPAVQAKMAKDLPPILFVDLDTEGNYEVLMDVEETLNASGEVFPALLTGNTLRYGEKAIDRWATGLGQVLPEAVLPTSVIELVRKAPKVVPFLEEAATAPSVPTAPVELPRPEASKRETPYTKATILYFETTGCKGCARAEKQLAFLKRRFPQHGFHRVNALESEGRVLQMAVATRLGLATESRLQTPMFASGKATCQGKTLTDKAVISLLEAAPDVPFWKEWDEAEALGSAERDLRSLAASFTVPTVLLAGLIDGINPCAFAVIIFLVSYLTLAQGMGKYRALCYGLLFCVGVYMCYFLIGVGFIRMLDLIEGWSGVLRGIFLATAAACFIFAAGAALDVLAARRRGTGAMRFGMPKRIRNLTHRLIRERVGTGLLGAGALLLGVVVSGLELVCTGQVYLPVIVFINSSSKGHGALGLLCAYNLAFIAPLLAVVFLGVFGVGSRAIAGWAGEHAIVMRGLTGALVLALGLIVLYMAFR
ncbi:MAG: hypothetical protein HN742_16925 [Lentisphaerae bacterium]|nr:hypothetical protein [Lentisphaerota bacterium]MBT4823133.1 hypothetical protein [Lentisphaerota bacterium]MBT5610479.1 hypothetical protein [Lentisphaerota bacterium]MBT7061070.1 hypothetical protein [Lentisphaerota bacterium]MBT7843565.1 hypothetical protein [Lentisphaerota bacterium]